MALENPHTLIKISGMSDAGFKYRRDQKFLQDGPGRGCGLVAVKGNAVGNDFAISEYSARANLDKDESPALLPAETCLEKVDIGQFQKRQFDSLDMHVYE
jgi:hypothetical protein